MYFLTALVCTVVSAVLWWFLRKKEKLHLEILPIAYGAATLMWLIDCIFSAAKGEGFLSFDLPLDGWISLWTVVGGILFWAVLSLILNAKKKN